MRSGCRGPDETLLDTHSVRRTTSYTYAYKAEQSKDQSGTLQRHVSKTFFDIEKHKLANTTPCQTVVRVRVSLVEVSLKQQLADMSL